MKRNSLLLLLLLSLKIGICQDSIRLDKIANWLEVKKFEGQYPFTIDTSVLVNGFTFYSVTPLVSNYSFLTIFDKAGAILEIEGMPSIMNRMPYQFETISNQYGETLLTTYYLGGGNISTSLKIISINITDSIRYVYDDIVYNRNNETEILTDLNSFNVKINNNKFWIYKTIGSPELAKRIIPKLFELKDNEKRKEKTDIIKIK